MCHPEAKAAVVTVNMGSTAAMRVQGMVTTQGFQSQGPPVISTTRVPLTMGVLQQAGSEVSRLVNRAPTVCRALFQVLGYSTEEKSSSSA